MLTDTKLRSLKAKSKIYKLSDSHGLHILVHPNGSKYWRQNYRYNGKQKTISHGVYPIVTLTDVRKLRDEVRVSLKDGIDPAKTKLNIKQKNANTFELIAKEWHERKSVNWQPNHARKVWYQLEKDIFPLIGDETIGKISPMELLNVLRIVESRGALDVASRLRQRCEGIFQHAILSERATYNPATQLIGVLKTKKVEHRKALSEKELPKFLRDLETFECHPITRLATKFLIHTFVRTGELRYTIWEELDVENALWTIPAHRMKMDTVHVVPLTKQSLTILEDLREINGTREFVFASPQRPRQPISENAILQLLYRMGYKNKATGHGFRATASTILNEHGFNPDAVERQLSHLERNKIRAAYNRSEYLKDRTTMMTWWSKYIEIQTKIKDTES